MEIMSQWLVTTLHMEIDKLGDYWFVAFQDQAVYIQQLWAWYEKGGEK